MFTGSSRSMPAAPTDAELRELAERLGAVLLRSRLTVTTAESCTGGWIAKVITDVPGSSQWFDRGFVAYSNAAKEALLGIEPAQLREHGAVSEVIAAAMAEGASRAAGADCALAVSGIAGPGGGSAEKPVGTVWFAWVLPAGIVTAHRHFGGNREDVRRRSVGFALEHLLVQLGD
jgi:nicotinamide-nucleotide amidase